MDDTELTPEALRLAWESGDLRYKMRLSQLEIQDAWIASQNRGHKFYIESTRRLGKSSFGLLLMTEECIKNPGHRWGFFAPVKDGLLDYVEPIIYKTYADCPEDQKPKFDKNRFLLTFPNGSTIIFRGANNQQHRTRRGLDLNGAFVDEGRDIDELDDLIESVVMPTLFTSNGWLILSSTPADTKSHPLYRYRTLAEAEKWLFRCPIQKASEYDPVEFSPQKIEAWKQESLSLPNGDEIWAREYDCEWIVSSIKAAVREWKDEYIQSPTRDPFYRFYHHYIGLDWGYKDFTALVFATWDFRKARLVVESELTFSGIEVRSDIIAEAIRRQIVKTWGEDAVVHKMISDSADPILINELNGHPGMNFIPVYKERSLEAMMNQFRVLVSKAQVLIGNNCPMTVSAVRNAVWTDKRDKLDRDAFSRHFDHLMALVYLSRMINFVDNPIPPEFGVDGARVIDLSMEKHPGWSQAAKAIDEAFTKRGK